MHTDHRGRRAAATVLAGTALLACLAGPSAAAARPPARTGQAMAAPVAVCRSWKHRGALAHRLSRDITAALRGRASVVAVQLSDPQLGLGCWLSSRRHFYSASVVKATILAALMLKARTGHRELTGWEKHEAYLMITRSSIPAADALWVDLGVPSLRRFLRRAHMTRTVPGPDGIWGLTRITTRDEIRFLWLLMRHNRVLTARERWYELRLMEHVIGAQRWGVTAGTPAGFTVHVKNGWVPSTPSGWLINSIGAFTRRGHRRQDYAMVVLSHTNPTMAYGIATIERVASRVNHDLHPASAAVIGLSRPSPAWGVPDEVIPARAWRHRAPMLPESPSC